ncbi:Cyclic pyranopterin monophosphate synthase [Candidatus Promineifilum breve]|uniref:GTP 3',8-cyclase n=1 Tax=Candidatus Promineifilum breve TaxID=1806508 RepID=A0A161K2N4_9CHLR|nr:GTP 3',8-cyclase MoaA [Candidatus Promineifilum breve]CUS02047.2 Cyclic pyranopterin monophosphate synthase [Candidatus Promineifilum breve]
MAFDRFGRNINYLRISLTDRCNLRCVYCMPEDMTFRPRSELLQDDELARLVRLFSGLGFHKFRLTGGEPTVRANVVQLVATMAATPGVEKLAMTTNGLLLDRLAQPLADAGLQRVNISIDTLDPHKFKKLTRWGEVEDVWRGIRAAEAAGLEIKLNAVVVRNYNDGEDVVDLARLTLYQPWQVRFIEMMPFGDVADFQLSGVVTQAELQETIAGALGELRPVNQGVLDGEASLFQLDGAPGKIGFISSISQPFCASCNRARLTADGRLRLCLLREKEVDLMTPLRAGATDEELEAIIKKGIWWKPWGHGLAQDVIPLNRVMSEIGG